MSSFAVGLSSVSFDAVYEQPNDGRVTFDGPVREFDLLLSIASAADETTLIGLRSWSVNVRPIPGGSNAFVDIAGGAGSGTLTLDNVTGSPFTGVLYHLDRGTAFPDGRRVIRARFYAW